MIVVFFDGLLTFYQIFLVNKKNIKGEGLELNKFVKYLFGKGVTPKKFIFIEIFTQLWIFTGFKLFLIFLPEIVLLYIGIIFGMFFTVNLYHIANIKKFKRMWLNTLYWIGLNKDIKSRG
jgi:hypothetical protein